MSESSPSTFVWPVRVYWEDTDAGGVVYHASYLRFMERARSEWMRALGVDQSRFKESTGLAFMVRDMQIDFLKAALLDDELSVTVEVQDRRAASILFGQTVSRKGGDDLVRATVRVACVDTRRMRAAPIPAELIPALTS